MKTKLCGPALRQIRESFSYTENDIGDEHLDLLGKIADCLDDEEVLEKMKTTNDIDWIMKKLS